MRSRFIFGALTLLLFAGGCGDGARGQGQAASPAPVRVSLEPVSHRGVVRTIEVTGTLYGDDEATISAKLSGRIGAVFADLGDTVPPAAPLALIERLDYELALAERRAAVAATLARIGLEEIPTGDFDPSEVPTVVRARVEEANALARFERARILFEQSPPLISEQEFADGRTAWEVARSGSVVELLTARAVLAEARTRAAEAAVAEQQLNDTLIAAPGGSAESRRYEVAERLASIGEYVEEGRPIFRLVASDPIEFRADVPERITGHVKAGQAVRVRVEAFPESMPGEVARVSPQVDSQSRTFRVEVRVPNADGRLKPGSFARGSIASHVEEGVTFVPDRAIVTFAGVQKVFGVRDGKAVEARIQTGLRADGWTEVAGALPFQAVVTSGADGLSNGQPVEVTAPEAP